MSGIQATTFSYVTEFHASDTRKRAVAIVSIFLPAVFVFASAFAWAIIPSNLQFALFGMLFKPWRIYLMFASTVHLATFCMITWLPESPKFLISMGRTDETIVAMRRIYAANTGEPSTVSVVILPVSVLLLM